MFEFILIATFFCLSFHLWEELTCLQYCFVPLATGDVKGVVLKTTTLSNNEQNLSFIHMYDIMYIWMNYVKYLQIILTGAYLRCSVYNIE